MAQRIVLAENSYIVSEGVRLVLEHAGFEVLAAAETFDELMEAVAAHEPDEVVTDIRMPPTRSRCRSRPRLLPQHGHVRRRRGREHHSTATLARAPSC